jgi:hypothetical protein
MGLLNVQGAALARENGSGGALEGQKGLIRREGVPIGHGPGKRDLGIENPKDFLNPGPAAKDACFPGKDAGAKPLGGIDERCVEIAGADVLSQGRGHLGADLRWV